MQFYTWVSLPQVETLNEYRILGKKGEGTFSEVMKCQDVKEGALWACKKLKHHYKSLEQVNNLREIQAMRRLGPHPNILELQEVLFDKKSGTLVLVCELMDMNIYELIRGRRRYLPEQKVKTYIYQLLKSIEHMHRNGIFHRDVKPENILIKEETLKLADFGSCRSIHSRQPYTEYISTRWYRAPECLLTDGYYTHKMDIWSVGCVFFEILSLHPLFPGSNEVDQIAKIHDVLGTPDPAVLNKLRNKTKGMNFNFPSKKGTGLEKLLPQASQESIELIYQMCTYDPDERITAKTALKHPYFKEFREAEKRVGAMVKAQKVQQQKEQIKREEEEIAAGRRKEKDERERKEEKEILDKHPDHSSEPIPENKENMDDNILETESKDKFKIDKVKRLDLGAMDKDIPPPKKGKSIRPGSHTSPPHIAKYHSNTLLSKGPTYQFHRKEKRRRRYTRRSTEANTSPESTSNSFFPKVIHPKPGSFQMPFRSSFSITSTTNNVATSKVSASNPTFLPSLSQAFVKPAKPKQSNQATKSIHGRYQLPSIDRRNGGF